MYRLSLGVFLAFLATAVAAMGSVSYFKPVYMGRAISDRNWVILHFFDGRFRLFWINGLNDAIVVNRERSGPNFRILRRSNLMIPPDGEQGPPAPRLDQSENRVQIGTRRSVDSWGGQWLWTPGQRNRTAALARISYFRVPVWFPVLLLLYQPIRAAVRGPMRHRYRSKRYLCVHCGYDLRGSTGSVMADRAATVGERSLSAAPDRILVDVALKKTCQTPPGDLVEPRCPECGAAIGGSEYARPLT